MIATMHDALPLFGFAALLIAGAALLDLGAWWTLRGKSLRRLRPRAGRIAFATVLAVASLPAWAYGALLALIGWASVGCAPDAYECPF